MAAAAMAVAAMAAAVTKGAKAVGFHLLKEELDR